MGCELPDSGTIKIKIVTARKNHKCCECHRIIEKGSLYQYYGACWPGINGWGSFKTCLECSELREEVVRKYGPICYSEDNPPFGQLQEWIKEMEG